jgi:hypothetical protein
MKKVRITAVALAVLMVCAVCPRSSAAASDRSTSGIISFWTNTSQISIALDVTGTTATCGSKITGHPGTTKIVATFVLERKSGGTYTNVKTFPTKTVYGEVLRFSDTCTVTSGYTYRLSVSAVVTRNGTNETVTAWTED